jgi:hypothetical protein
MRDDNDFFDDLIDDETETETYDLSDAEDEDDEDEDDDEPVDVRTAVLVKDGMLALLTMKTNESGGQIVRIDPRESVPTAQRYDDAESAVKWFNRSLATSGRNGWAVVYDGEPLFG